MSFRILSEKEFREYELKYLRLPPSTYLRDRIIYGLKYDIPIEFFILAKIVTAENLDKLGLPENADRIARYYYGL